MCDVCHVFTYTKHECVGVIRTPVDSLRVRKSYTLLLNPAHCLLTAVNSTNLTPTLTPSRNNYHQSRTRFSQLNGNPTTAGSGHIAEIRYWPFFHNLIKTLTRNRTVTTLKVIINKFSSAEEKSMTVIIWH